jgi:hypothetical protein
MVRLPVFLFYQQLDSVDPEAAPRRRTLAEWAEHNRKPEDGKS